MSGGPEQPVYVDSSFLVSALTPDDPGHQVAAQALIDAPSRVSSVLSEVEVARALRRRRADPRVRAAGRRLVASCELVEVDDRIRAAAAESGPSVLRSLDAIHLASALAAGVGRFLTFDARQRVAAEDAGLDVTHPAG